MRVSQSVSQSVWPISARLTWSPVELVVILSLAALAGGAAQLVSKSIRSAGWWLAPAGNVENTRPKLARSVGRRTNERPAACLVRASFFWAPSACALIHRLAGPIKSAGSGSILTCSLVGPNLHLSPAVLGREDQLRGAQTSQTRARLWIGERLWSTWRSGGASLLVRMTNDDDHVKEAQ